MRDVTVAPEERLEDENRCRAPTIRVAGSGARVAPSVQFVRGRVALQVPDKKRALVPALVCSEHRFRPAAWRVPEQFRRLRAPAPKRRLAGSPPRCGNTDGALPRRAA